MLRGAVTPCEFYDFYRTPRGEFTRKGSSLTLTTHATLSSNVKFMNFYPFSDIETNLPAATRGSVATAGLSR